MDNKTLEMVRQMEMNRDKQSFEAVQEKSTPVQSRIDLTTLAELDIWWMREGYNIKTMSQLVSWSVGLLRKILTDNEKMPRQFETLEEAHKYLGMRGLYQTSLKKRGFDKTRMAIAFEGLREQGIDPKGESPRVYEKLHNERSVEPFVGKISTEYVSLFEDDYTKAKLAKQQELFEERQRQKKDAIEERRVQGNLAEEPKKEVVGGLREGMSKGELDEYDKKREAEVLAKENTPVEEQLEWMRRNIVKE